MARQTSRAFLLSAVVIGLSVNSKAAPQSAVAEDSTAAGTKAAGILPGYVHDLSRSRFKIGENTFLELDTPSLRRFRGSLGAWAIDPTNNWSMGIIDSATPRGPYIVDDAVHGELVKQYFITAGIPADQIRDVRTTYQVGGGGAVKEASLPKPVQLQSLTSILTRSVMGIPVVESLAWAKMTASGEAEIECVFWPSIDIGVVNRAVAFAKQMADPALRAAYFAKLPGHVYRDAGVAIHHTDASIHESPQAYVSYDVALSPEGHAAVRHFDENGTEFQLRQEMTTSPLRGLRPNPRKE